MEKEEFPALLPAGIHTTTFEQIKFVAVEKFPNSNRRGLLYNNLIDWATKIQALGFHGLLWIDGSFSTRKEDPEDIDLVFLIEEVPEYINSINSNDLKLILNKNYVATTYNLDLYPISKKHMNDHEYENHKSYWRGWFGFCRDGKTAKGIWEVKI